MKRISSVVIVIILLIVFVQTASAATPSTPSKVNFPPVTSGPGYILPDSPLYVIDQVKQNTKLLFARTPERKAAVRSEIAGERLAELRVMFNRNNVDGIDTALNQLNRETYLAAKDLSEAQAQGQNVSKQAQDLNETIKEQRKLLASLSNQTTGALQLQLLATRQGLLDTKVEVENILPEGDLAKEIEENLQEQIAADAQTLEVTSKNLELSLVELNRQVTEASQKSLTRREQALQEAIAQKNKALEAEAEKALEAEQDRQEELAKEQAALTIDASTSIVAAQNAVKTIQSVQESIAKITNEPVVAGASTE